MDVYPNRPVTLVVGAPAGAGIDRIARQVATHMSKDLDAKVFVENRPEEKGNAGVEYVKRSAADGHTVYLALRADVRRKSASAMLDASKDFVPVALLARVPYVLVSGKHVCTTSLQDTFVLMFQRRRIYTCASEGGESVVHLLCEVLKKRGGLIWKHVPYMREADALADVIGGGADLAIVSLPATLPYIKSDRVRPLAVFAETRVVAIPSVPGINEHGYVDPHVPDWCAVMAPVGTPSNVVDRLNHAVNAALSNAEVGKQLASLGYAMPPKTNTPEALRAFLAADTARWGRELDEHRLMARQ
ncbi:tripartite tricarboxylate transporter substrate binding protein [Achromobacter aloeverae]|nr:tripartite tricarboxylate transporter substrate binding protein [Achromobacter aloeverae]